MNIVAINGSPRPNGNTAALAEALLSGARDAGAETTLLQLGRMSITGCRACKQCKRTHRCVIQDDMQPFYDLAPRADAIALLSPIYLDHITAQLMTFIQRLYCYLGAGLENYYPQPKAKVLLGITFGVGRSAAYDDVLDWMEARMKGYFELETVDSFRLAGTSHDHPVRPGHPELQRATQAGRALVH